jgi:hypothetical protein
MALIISLAWNLLLFPLSLIPLPILLLIVLTLVVLLHLLFLIIIIGNLILVILLLQRFVFYASFICFELWVVIVFCCCDFEVKGLASCWGLDLFSLF